MTEINLNGETYVRKDGIQVDREMVVNYLKNNTDNYDFLEIVKEINELKLQDVNYADIDSLILNGSSGNMERELLQIHYALRDVR